MTPRACILCNGVGVVFSLSLMIVSYSEWRRFTPFYTDVDCRKELVSEFGGLRVVDAPLGLYKNLTVDVKCSNPNQISVTTVARNSEIFFPDVTNLSLGGNGLPYMKVATVHLASVSLLAAEKGGAMTTVTEFAWPLGHLVASAAETAMRGYVPAYVRTESTTTTCLKLFGLPLCSKGSKKQWCGSLQGTCAKQAKDVNGVVLEPVRWTASFCALAVPICSDSEEDMKTSLHGDRLDRAVVASHGIEFLESLPCASATGLPNTTLCTTIRGPGIDSFSQPPLQQRDIYPLMRLTPRAQALQSEGLEQAEKRIQALLTLVWFVSLVLLVGFVACLFCQVGRLASVRGSTMSDATEPQALEKDGTAA